MRVVRSVAFCLLVGLGAVVVIGPSNLAWSAGYMVRSASGFAFSDHLQSTYHLWLWVDAAVTQSHLPWHDPFQFALTGHTVNHPFGWPLVLVFAPIHAAPGPVAAFNRVMLAAFVAAASCTHVFVRSLGLSRSAAGVAGFAFAFAPYRLAQSDHINSLLAFMLPLILFLVDRTFRDLNRARIWAWACVAAYLSLVASGEMHLVPYGTPLFLTLAVVRYRRVPSHRLRELIGPAWF